MASLRYYSTSHTPLQYKSLKGQGHHSFITAPSSPWSAIILANSYGNFLSHPGYTKGRRHTNMWCRSYWSYSRSTFRNWYRNLSSWTRGALAHRIGSTPRFLGYHNIGVINESGARTSLHSNYLTTWPYSSYRQWGSLHFISSCPPTHSGTIHGALRSPCRPTATHLGKCTQSIYYQSNISTNPPASIGVSFIPDYWCLWPCTGSLRFHVPTLPSNFSILF